MTLTRASSAGQKPFQAFPVNSLVTVALIIIKKFFLHVHQCEVASINILEPTVAIFSLYSLAE